MVAETPDVLRRDLRAARERALRVTADIGGERLLGPKLRIVNPPLWEIGHVSWFQERWCLRWRPDGTLGDSFLPGADALYDSSAVAHDTRWGLPLPDSNSLPGDLEFPGGALEIGSRRSESFVFDNEKWAHEVRLAPFRIARAPVTNGEFLACVEAGGAAPRYWMKEDGAWRERRYDRWIPFAPEAPVRHVSWHEAQAYCAWAKRRLPTEAEWECASARLDYGQLWEWTASDFAPYPGFSADPYEDYSQPWFHTHKVLRGASFFTPKRLRWPGIVDLR